MRSTAHFIRALTATAAMWSAVRAQISTSTGSAGGCGGAEVVGGGDGAAWGEYEAVPGFEGE